MGSFSKKPEGETKRTRRLAAALFVALWSLGTPGIPGVVAAAPPTDVGFRGVLRDAAGEPLVGRVDIEVGIWDQLADGSRLYGELHQNVLLTAGAFSLRLGTGIVQQGRFEADLFEDPNRYLELIIDGETLAPRQVITSVPYALQSQNAQQAVFALAAGEADRLDGREATELDESAHVADRANPHGVTPGQAGASPPAEVAATMASHAGEAAAHHAKTVSFGELADAAMDAQIPATITRDAELSTGLAPKADVGHAHDSSYATRGEVDGTFLGPVEARLAALTTLLAGLERDGDTLRFSGMNVQIVNATGTTDGTPNGLGNLIVGYNELRGAEDSRGGSHSVVVGMRNNFRSYSGLVVGETNQIEGPFSSVTAGRENAAVGAYAHVSGGFSNTAYGEGSSILGGESNETGLSICIDCGQRATVSGGLSNVASGNHASVSGGTENRAAGSRASVLGGWSNEASGTHASVTAGEANIASGTGATVSGGWQNTASGHASNVAAGRGNQATGPQSSVKGGSGNNASALYSSVSGGGGKVADAVNESILGAAIALYGAQVVATGTDTTVMGPHEYCALNEVQFTDVSNFEHGECQISQNVDGIWLLSAFTNDDNHVLCWATCF